MITNINELYKEAVAAGKKISEIAISYIAYDHLKSELKNRKEEPSWLNILKVKEGIHGVQFTEIEEHII